MFLKKGILIGLLGVFLCMFFIFNTSITESSSLSDRILELLEKEYKPIEPLLPVDIKVQPDFKAGIGPVIGNVQTAVGEVYVVHQNQLVAYRLKKESPLYSNDMIITGERSRVNISLQDQSVFSLAPYSKLTIDECIYNPQKKERSSTFSLLFGRARFIVQKLMGKPNYNVKTPTAVCGVRGSDFALSVSNETLEMSSSSKKTLFSGINLIKSAHAQPPAPMVTALVTGAETSVNFAGLVGAAQTVGPGSVCAAASGLAAVAPISVGLVAAGSSLGNIGPGLASLSMPLD